MSDMSVVDKQAEQMRKIIFSTLRDLERLVAGYLAMTGTDVDPLADWCQQRLVSSGQMPSAQTVGSEFSKRQQTLGSPSAATVGAFSASAASGLSVAKKYAIAVKSDPERWWDYDAVMRLWEEREDPIGEKSRLRTAASQLKKRGSDKTGMEFRDGGLARVARPPLPDEPPQPELALDSDGYPLSTAGREIDQEEVSYEEGS